MRTKFMKTHDGKTKFELDDDWPIVIASFGESERVIATADGHQLILQLRHRDQRNHKWSGWRYVGPPKSPKDMRKLMESDHPFVSDSEV